MTSMKVNNFMYQGASSPDQQSDCDQIFTQDQLRDFKDRAQVNEAKVFEQILVHIPPRDMSIQEKEIIREEMQTQNSMILMIFRFFLQSNEYQFFVRRLKNISMTKISLKQLRTNETILNQRSDEKNLGFIKIEDEIVQKPQNDYAKISSNQGSNGYTQGSTKSYSLFQTPQKGHSSKTLINSNLNSTDQDRNYANRGVPSSGLNSGIKEINQQVNRRQSDLGQINGIRQALIPKNSVLNQKDGFKLKQQKCLKGNSPRKQKHPQVMSFGAALSQIADLGVDLTHMRDYMQENNMARNGPSAHFTEVIEATGGKTPPPQIQSDSECGTANERTPTRVDSEKQSQRQQTNQLTPTQNPIPVNQLSESELMKSLDVSYAMNILRHQASKKHQKIEIEDLILCFQIVSRQRYTQAQLQQEVNQLFDEIIQSEPKPQQRQFSAGQQRWVYFEEVFGPIVVKNMIENNEFTIENGVRKMFECFRLQFGMQALPFDSIKRFLTSSIFFIFYKRLANDKNQVISQFIKVAQEYFSIKGLTIENGVNFSQLQLWLSQYFSSTSLPNSNNGSPYAFKNQALQQNNSRSSTATPTYNYAQENRMSTLQQPSQSGVMLQNYNLLNPSVYTNSNNRPHTANVSYTYGPQMNQSRSPQKELSVSQNYEMVSQTLNQKSLLNQNSSLQQQPDQLIDFLEKQKLQNRYSQGLNSLDTTPISVKNKTTASGQYVPQSSILQRIQNEQQTFQGQSQKAQRTYTLGFNGGLMESLNSQSTQNSIAQKERQRMSDGFLNVQYSNNDIIRLRPQIMSGNSRAENLSMGRNNNTNNTINVNDKFSQLSISNQPQRKY